MNTRQELQKLTIDTLELGVSEALEFLLIACKESASSGCFGIKVYYADIKSLSNNAQAAILFSDSGLWKKIKFDHGLGVVFHYTHMYNTCIPQDQPIVSISWIQTSIRENF